MGMAHHQRTATVLRKAGLEVHCDGKRIISMIFSKMVVVVVVIHRSLDHNRQPVWWNRKHQQRLEIGVRNDHERFGIQTVKTSCDSDSDDGGSLLCTLHFVFYSSVQ